MLQSKLGILLFSGKIANFQLTSPVYRKRYNSLNFAIHIFDSLYSLFSTELLLCLPNIITFKIAAQNMHCRSERKCLVSSKVRIHRKLLS